MTNSIEDIDQGEVILVIGSNTTENHPVIGMRIRRAVRQKGVKLIVADPRKIDLAHEAHIYLPIRPGTDIALVNAMMHVILKEGLHDQAFIDEHTEGFEDLRRVVEKYTPEYAAEITGVKAEDIIAAARMYGSAGRAAIVYCMGITQHTKGTDNVKSLANLALICGNIGKPGSGINPLRGQNNVQGACDMGGLPATYPGYQPVNNPDVKKKFEAAWGVKLSDKVGLTVVEMGHAALDGRVKAMYVMGENPALSDPDLHHLQEAFKKLDLLIVQDIFFNDTCRYAHVVLPSASFAEKDGTFTNTERRVQRVRRALDPPGEARDDWWIISQVASRLGYPMSYESAEEIFEEIRKVTPQYAGITYKRIEKCGIQWPCPSEDHPGTPILHVGKIARGRGLLTPIEYRPPVEQPDSEFPFVLTTGRNYYHYHTGTMTRRSRVSNYYVPEPYLEMNPYDAEEMGISDGEVVKVMSRRGEIAVKVKISDRVKRGEVFSTFHFSEAAANILTIAELDPVAKIPEFKVTAVRIEKA
ncbi:formate dehydrogenase major subunit [Thermodesulforhabdus norvegica]|nr:formate dehydrogenase major subunit [Thermodesulforhabdus norvegica]